MRKSWDIHHMGSAKHAADMCTCAAGRKVGAVFVRDNRVLATGYNGVPSGFPHPTTCKRKEAGVPSGERLDMCGCVHAEMNAVANAARDGVALRGATLYCTTEPCALCMGVLTNVGVTSIKYGADYHHKLSGEIAAMAGIDVTKVAEEEET